MKKLTNTQIKSIKGAYESKPVDININGETIGVMVKTHLTSVDCDKIQKYVDTVVFIDDEYYPQYFDIAVNVAWLAVCTNIPIVMVKKTNTDQQTEEYIDWDTSDIVAQHCLDSEFDDTIYTSHSNVQNIARRYIDHKLQEHYSTLSKQTADLVRRSEEAIDFIEKVSKEMASVYGNPELIQEMKELTSTTQDLNKRFDMSASDNFIKLITKEQ